MKTAALLGVLTLYAVTTGGLLLASQARTGGSLVYPLDDTYVHMAIAKHAALDGVWGVTSERFTSASSSPLWTALIAAVYAAIGVTTAAPLVLNVIAGLALLVVVHRIGVAYGMPPLMAAVVSTTVLFAGTVPTLTMLGMEHTLHALLTVLFVIAGARAAGAAASAPVSVAGLSMLAAALTLTRYEGAFAVAAIAVALAGSRRWRAAVAVAVAGGAPIVLFGWWSLSQGGFLLPNSVLLKAATPSLSLGALAETLLLSRALSSLPAVPHLAALLVAVVGLALVPARDGRARERRIMAAVFASCVLLHLQFARAGWFFRYEAYLVVLGVIVAALLARGARWPAIVGGRRPLLAGATALVLVAVLAFPLARRAATALRQVPGAVSNIFEQHYQAAMFLDTFYRGARIAVNDVGAIGFLTDVKLLDLYGLASSETAALKRRGAYDSATVARLAAEQDVAIAIIYPTWLEDYGGVPAGWQKIGEWRVADNLVLGENGMSFFAVRADAITSLAEHLAEYASRLPATVVQQGAYLVPR